MEELLNKLIKKGRVPFGIYGNGDLEGERIYIEEQDEYTNEYRLKVYWINVDYVEFNGLCDEDKQFSDRFSLREIVSKSSGLWQFVCNHGLINTDDKGERIKNFRFDGAGGISIDGQFYFREYQYRLIESALRSEDELEDFLLSNIKVNTVDKKELERLEKLNNYEDL